MPDMQPSHAIIHTRFLFHRADPFKEEGDGTSKAADIGVGRYSVRYMVGTAEAEKPVFADGKVVFGTKIRLADADPTHYPSCVLKGE